MGIWSFITNSSYRDGYNGGERYLGQEGLSDDEHWDKYYDLRDNRTDGYNQGFYDCVDENASERTNPSKSFFWKVLFGA